jgi:hypothetical protein
VHVSLILGQGTKEEGLVDSHRSVNEKSTVGGPLRGEEEKLADVLVRNPLFSNVVFLVRTRDQRPRFKGDLGENFSYCEDIAL